MATKTIIICDCCGMEAERGFNDGLRCGKSTLKIKGTEGGKCNGVWGGCSHEIDDLLCFECSKKLRDFYKEMKSSNASIESSPN